MLREKAGIDASKKEEIEKIIKECTENSKFSILEKSKKENLLKKSEQVVEYLSSIDKEELDKTKIRCDSIYEGLEKILKLLIETKTVYAHIDMDAFFAQVETLDNPSLANVPMAVGGLSMLATSNYEARKFGVRAAMPGFIAKKLCPELIIVPADFSKYEKMSKIIKDIFKKYDPDMVSVGLDEAYLNISHLVTDRKGIEESVLKFIHDIKKDVWDATKLTCSIGVSHSNFLAKVCSNINKPNGHYMVLQSENDENTLKEFAFKQPVGRINGVGPVTEGILKAIDVNFCRDIYEKREQIETVFGAKRAFWLFSCSIGIDEPCYEPQSELKSKSHTIGLERTFKPTSDVNLMLEYIEDLSNEIREMMKDKMLKTNKVTLKIKFDNFRSITRTHTFKELTDSYSQIKNASEELLLREVDGKQSVRLLGLRINKMSTPVSSPVTPSRINQTLDKFWKKTNGEYKDNTFVNCPICLKKLYNDNRTINKHIDECLAFDK